ncbi:hypothetical protein ACIBJE_25785 [Micromonospora sp. NPDC050187]|uniref:hypothetical protein n=1 Tax=Micromonospora sp. NPDC050187 TaxID=3364277 RepID=UPI0037A71B90
MLTLTARWPLAGMVLPLVLAGCAAGSRSSGSEVASPTPTREYRLVDDLCDQLDPTPLTTLSGIPTTQTKDTPVRPEARHRSLSCGLSAVDRENAWVYSLQVTVILDGAATPAAKKLTSRGAERTVPDLGDRALIHIADTLTLDNPVREGQKVQSQTGMLRVVEGRLHLQLSYSGHSGTAPAVVDAEALLTGYARQTLELLGG